MDVGRNGIKKVSYLRIVIPAELKPSHLVLKLLCLINGWEEFGLGLLILHGGLMRDLCKIARGGFPVGCAETDECFLVEVVGVGFVDIQKSLAN